jgi:chromosome segregation ATPase
MDARLKLRLAGLDQEIASARARLARLAEEGARRTGELEQTELRLLMAETPLADAHRHAAAARVRSVGAQVAVLEERLVALEAERDTLPGGGPQTPAPTGP